MSAQEQVPAEKRVRCRVCGDVIDEDHSGCPRHWQEETVANPSNQSGEIPDELLDVHAICDQRDALRAEVERLTKIAEAASNVSLMLQADEADESEGMDIAEWCETVDELRRLLRPWREARLAAFVEDKS